MRIYGGRGKSENTGLQPALVRARPGIAQCLVTDPEGFESLHL